MIKLFTYIVLLLLFASRLTLASPVKTNGNIHSFEKNHNPYISLPIDTLTAKKIKQEEEKKKAEEEKKKVKEIAKAKRQAKPEKVDEPAAKPKTKRERRPEGMERPPEIPRRNGN